MGKGGSSPKKDYEQPFEETKDGEIVVDGRIRRATRRLQRPVAGNHGECFLRVELMMMNRCCATAAIFREWLVPAGFGLTVTIIRRSTVCRCRKGWRALRFVARGLDGRMVCIMLEGMWEGVFIILGRMPEGKHVRSSLRSWKRACISGKETDKWIEILVVNAWFRSQEMLRGPRLIKSNG